MQPIVSRPGVVGSLTPKWFCSRSKTASLSFGVTPTEPMPCTFEWPRIGSRPALRPADHAAQQRQVDDRLHVVDAVHVMRDAHRPTEDDVLRRGVAVGDLVDLGSRARRSCATISSHDSAREPRASARASLRSARSRNGSSIAPISTMRLAMPVSSARSPPMCGCTYRLAILRAEQQAPHVARHAEVDQPGFDDRIDDDHLAAAAADVHQRAHQPRMIAGRVAADDEHQVGVLDVFERDRGRAAAE